ncbi:Hypothetical predicted protein [Paramuricea clavata]|uniref:Uncharacterized protein n=1 Tax=Paramuricea clavata TaxID=317549 RepID=A0A7D9IYH5_PARCT|nr:Hypothetical predicted protein [Paramuricea clavata]
MLGAAEAVRNIRRGAWHRHDIVSCHCPELSYVHVHCPCQVCNSNAVSTATEYRHWSRACECMDTDVDSETTESSDGELGGGLNDLDVHLTVDNNIAHTTFHENMSSLGSTSTEPSDDECDPIADSDCTLESPLTNPDEREIVTAILEALNLVDQMQGSHKHFVDVLEFSEKLYSRNNDGEQPVKYMWPKRAIEVTIANMYKAERSKVEEVYVVGFVPSYLLLKKCPCLLDPFLDLLVTDVEDIFIHGLEVDYVGSISGLRSGRTNIRCLILLWTGDYPAQCKVGKFINCEIQPCRRDKLQGTSLNGGSTYYYGENRLHARFPWGKRNLNDEVEVMCTIGEEDRSSVRANLSKHTAYTGISVLHRLHKIYEFDVIRDTVFDMMHNLPLNVVRKHVKRVMDEGIVDKNEAPLPHAAKIDVDKMAAKTITEAKRLAKSFGNSLNHATSCNEGILVGGLNSNGVLLTKEDQQLILTCMQASGHVEEVKIAFQFWSLFKPLQSVDGVLYRVDEDIIYITSNNVEEVARVEAFYLSYLVEVTAHWQR